MQPTHETPVTTMDDIKQRLEGIPGVVAIDVDLRDAAAPRVRVRLDGSVPEADVGEEIQRRLAVGNPHKPPVPVRRAGLGRDLSDILAAEAEVPAPRHLQHPEPEPQPELALVAVEETAGGIAVRAADSIGGLAFSPVEDPRSLNQAVVSAVGRLRHERPLPRLSGVEIRDVNGASVLTVVLTRANGKRTVGAALVEGGMPFTLGTAVWDALANGR